MAARAGSVHLISSMDRKPSRKGGARPRPKHHHPVPQGPPFSMKCRLATGCPPEAHNQSQLKPTASSRPKHTQTLRGRSATPPTQELTSFPVWAGFRGHHRIRDTPTYRRGQVLGADIQTLAREATPNRKQ